MFKAFIASVVLFFSSFFTSTHTTSPEVQKANSIKYDSYFEYETNVKIYGKILIGEHKAIQSSSAERTYAISNIKFQIPDECEIEHITLNGVDYVEGTEIDINDIKYLPFSLTFKQQCKTNVIKVYGKIAVHNKILYNDKEFKSTSQQSFGPITIHNKSPFLEVDKVNISFHALDKNNTIMQNTVKSFVVQIKNGNNFNYSNESIKSVLIRTLDSDRLQLVSKQGETIKYVNELMFTKQSYINFGLKAFDELGDAYIEIEAIVLDRNGFENKAKRMFRVSIIENTIQPVKYTIVLNSLDGNNEIARNSTKSFLYQIKDSKGNNIENSLIEDVSIRTLDLSMLQLMNGEQAINEITGLNSAADSFVLRALNKTGIGKIEIKAKIRSSLGIEREIKQDFSIKIVQNSNEDAFKIKIISKDYNFILLNDSEKVFSYQIVDKNGEQIPDEFIKSISFRTMNGRLVKFIKDSLTNKYVNMLTYDDQVAADGEFTLKSFDEKGTTKIEIIATIEYAGSQIVLKKYIYVIVNMVPSDPYKLLLFLKNESLLVGQNGIVSYEIVSSTTNKIVEPSFIKSITFKTTNAKNLVLVDNNGNEKEEISLTQPPLQSKGYIFVRAKKSGDVGVEVNVILHLHNKDVQLHGYIAIPITLFENNGIIFQYAGTEYNKTSGYFEDKYTLLVQNSQLEGKTIEIGAITPKILYPNVYYTKFLTGELDPWNSAYSNYMRYIYYRDVYNDMNNLADGRLYKIRNRVAFGVTDARVYRRLDLTKVIPSKDKLLILPNKKHNSIEYLGGWKIQEVVSDTTLIVNRNLDDNLSNLSYVIGNNTRYNITNDTVAGIVLDNRNGKYVVKDGMVQFKLYYPTFFAGKDVFFYVNYNDGEKVMGNTYKRVLTGTKLASTQPEACENRVCAYRVKVYFEDNNQPLQFSRFGARCSGENIQGLYFTSTLNSCVNTLNYGYKINQKTNGNGETLLCVYPKAKYEERTDPDTNQTYKVLSGYETASPQCNFTVAEEFPY